MQNFGQKNQAKRLNILVVDDDTAIQDLYRQAFHAYSHHSGIKYDFELTACLQGDEAVETVRQSIDENNPFTVIFLDLNLPPGPGGLWAAKEIRKIDPYVNFIIVTGRFDVDPLEIASQVPSEDKLLYIQKPFSIYEILQFAVSLGSKWLSETHLRKLNEELEHANSRLLDTNNALSVLAGNIEDARKESEKRIIKRVRTIIIPFIQKIQEDKHLEKYSDDLALLEDYIENLTSDLATDIKIAASLTVTELHIASMIKNGMSTVEVADHLCISTSTVKTHRKNIRRKLNIQHSALNLKDYLRFNMNGTPMESSLYQ